MLALRKREIIAQRRATAATAVQRATQHDAADAPHRGQPGRPWRSVAAKYRTRPWTPAKPWRRAARLSPPRSSALKPSKKPPELVACRQRSANSSLQRRRCARQLPWPSNEPPPKTVPRACKGAAERIRQSPKKLPRQEDGPAEPTTQPSAGDAAPPAPADTQALQARIATLEEENQRLRLQVQTLQELLAEQGQ